MRIVSVEMYQLIQLSTLYGVGFSLLMWSGRIFLSCVMQRSLMSFNGGRSSLIPPSINKNLSLDIMYTQELNCFGICLMLMS